MNFKFVFRAQSETEVFKVLKSGKSRRKGWKRMVTKVTFVGDNFTRKPPKFERFIRPMGLRMNKAHVTHPELKATFCLPIIGVKKNPSSPMYTNLGVITKVNVSKYFCSVVTNTFQKIWFILHVNFVFDLNGSAFANQGKTKLQIYYIQWQLKRLICS